MTARLGQTGYVWDVQRALKEAGFVWKCIINLAAEANPVKQKMYRDTCLMRGYIADNYVFVDEVGTVSLGWHVVTLDRVPWIQGNLTVF